MKLSKDAVDGHVATLMISLDKDSPFAGMVDLSDLGKMPHDHQMQIWNALEPAYQLLYEEMTDIPVRSNKPLHIGNE